MNASSAPWRLRVVSAAIAVTFAALAGRLVQLQWLDAAELADRAARQRTLFEPVPARPGDVVDRRGRLLATTVSASSLYAVPTAIKDPAAFARSLAPAVGLDADTLARDLERNAGRSFVWIRRRLTEGQVAAVRALGLPREAWGFRDEFHRRYPQGVLAAHLVGLRDIDNRGRGGVEERYDALIRGRDGRRVAVRDARGRIVGVRSELAVPAEPGRTVVLSIDSVLQLRAERALDEVLEKHKPIGGCAIAIEVATGDVLALASRPTFDPNRPAAAAGDAWPNRAVTAVYEPGSTFKPLVAAWAIDAGLLEPDETLDCEGGAYRLGRRILHDHHGYGELSVTDVLVKSSNIGMAKIGERLGIDGLHGCTIAFGFGRPTGSGLPGELPGLVRPREAWTDYSIASVPMGHELLVTPLQLAVAHVALANGGRLVSPRVVLRDIDRAVGGASDAAPPARVASPTVRPDAAAWAVAAMTEVVGRGTGKAAQIDGVAVFGKTGTAQKFDAEAGAFSHTRHVVSFVAGAPVEKPAVVVLVMVDEPTEGGQSGGAVAAPAAAAILGECLWYLGVSTGVDETARR